MLGGDKKNLYSIMSSLLLKETKEEICKEEDKKYHRETFQWEKIRETAAEDYLQRIFDVGKLSWVMDCGKRRNELLLLFTGQTVILNTSVEILLL